MAFQLGNRIRVVTATTGTGTVTLGAAYSNLFVTFAGGGITDGSTVAYCIEDGTDFEIGTGVYTASGTTMTRASVLLSNIGGVAGTTKLDLSGSADVRVVLAAEHAALVDKANTFSETQTFSNTIELGHATENTLSASGGVLSIEGSALYKAGGTDVAIADGGTGASLSDPGADRLLFWDASGNVVDWLTPGNGLTITTTTIAVDSASQIVDGIVELATAAELRTGTDTARVPAVDQIWAAGAGVSISSSSNSVAIDMASGINFQLSSLTENTTFANSTNGKAGQSGLIHIVPSTTSTRTISLGANYRVPPGVEPFPISVTTSNYVVISYFCELASPGITWITGVHRFL